jgi:hypothetical protein
MLNDLTDSQIALLCDIGEFNQDKASEEQKRDLERLLAEGFVEEAKGGVGTLYALSSKGGEFLSERGAGLNEA